VKSGDPMKAPETPLTAEELQLALYQVAAHGKDARGTDAAMKIATSMLTLVRQLTEATRQLADQQTALAAMREQLDDERMKLAACGVAAMQNTRLTAREHRLNRDSQFWTASYGDVCAAVDREMAARERAEAAESALAARPTLPAEPPPPHIKCDPTGHFYVVGATTCMCGDSFRVGVVGAYPAAAAPLPSAEAWTPAPQVARDGDWTVFCRDGDDPVLVQWDEDDEMWADAEAFVYETDEFSFGMKLPALPKAAPPVVVASPDQKS
jgi:hypothetical protein